MLRPRKTKPSKAARRKFWTENAIPVAWVPDEASAAIRASLVADAKPKVDVLKLHRENLPQFEEWYEAAVQAEFARTAAGLRRRMAARTVMETLRAKRTEAGHPGKSVWNEAFAALYGRLYNHSKGDRSSRAMTFFGKRAAAADDWDIPALWWELGEYRRRNAG